MSMTRTRPPAAATSPTDTSLFDPAGADSGRFDTLAVRGGEPKSYGYHAATMPMVCTATYTFDSSQAIHDHFQGKVERGEYGRYGNPTVRVAEQKLSALEGAQETALFGSGMAAIATFLLEYLKPGDHVVMTSDCYRRTRQFIRTTLAKYGITHSFVPPGDYDALSDAVQPETRLIVSEAPTNPYLRVVDVARLAEIRRKHRRVKLLVDATLATPYNFRPLEHGADLVVHSCTKYLGGHNDLLAGSISGARDLISAMHDARGVFGGILDPHAGYLLIRGIKTFSVRMKHHNQSALRIAEFLEGHPAVERVFYPGLASHPDHEVARKQFHGFGGIVSFLVRGDLERTIRFIDACQIPSVGPSMGGVETLIEQPALISFYELTTEQRQALGIANNLVRLSVGLESTDDLVADLDQALRATS